MATLYRHQLDKVTAAMLADDGPTPLAFLRKARQIEASIAEAKQEEAMGRHNHIEYLPLWLLK